MTRHVCISVTTSCLSHSIVPSASPTNLKGNNLTSQSIIVYWSPMPLKRQNGIIIGYRVQFRDASANQSMWMETTFNRTANNGTIFNLMMFHPYYIRIAGMTSKGVGIFSKEIKVWTEEDCKSIRLCLQHAAIFIHI